MALLIGLSIIFYIFMYVFTILFLTKLPLLGFIGLVYFLPLVINGVMITYIYIKKTSLSLLECYIFPLISTLSYWVFGTIIGKTTAWYQFVSKYTYTNGDMYVKIKSNLISISQIVFVTLLYFSVQFLISLFIKKIKGKKINENN